KALSPTTPARPAARPRFEALEDRQLLAANLWITDAYLTDAMGNKLTSAAAGSLVSVQAEFKTQGLPANAKYVVRFSLDNDSRTRGVPTWGAGGVGTGSYAARLGEWVVTSGFKAVKAEIDATNTVAESSEADNNKVFGFSPATFSSAYGQSKFVTPIAGTP